MKMTVRNALKELMKGFPEYNFAQAIVMVNDEVHGDFSFESLSELTIKDVIEIRDEIFIETYVPETFESLTALLDTLNGISDGYGEGLVDMAGFNSQAIFRILEFVRDHKRPGSCFICDKDRVGNMEFICDECHKTPE